MGTRTILVLVLLPPSMPGGVTIVQPAATASDARTRATTNDRVFIAPPPFPCPGRLHSLCRCPPCGAPAAPGRAAPAAAPRTAYGAPLPPRAASAPSPAKDPRPATRPPCGGASPWRG